MHTATLSMSREAAALAFRKYREHKAYQTPIDFEIERIYGAIAKGKIVIEALRSIREAGLGADGLPKLAIARADAKKCYLEDTYNGGCTMASDMRWVNGKTAKSRYEKFADNSFPGIKASRGSPYSAVVPHIPPEHRPKRGIQNYHILFEAHWSPEPPVDPLLLRRLTAGDVWLVVAAWDLTEVERAAMRGHI